MPSPKPQKKFIDSSCIQAHLFSFLLFKLSRFKVYTLDYTSLCDYITVLNMLGVPSAYMSKKTYGKILEFGLLDKCAFSISVFASKTNKKGISDLTLQTAIPFFNPLYF